MSDISETTKQNIRIQDIVAKTARVNLKDTVRVLRALSMVWGVMGDKGAKARLDSWLHQATLLEDDYVAPLGSKPEILAIDACNAVYDSLREEYSVDDIEDLYSLEGDPFYERVLAGEE